MKQHLFFFLFKTDVFEKIPQKWQIHAVFYKLPFHHLLWYTCTWSQKVQEHNRKNSLSRRVMSHWIRITLHLIYDLRFAATKAHLTASHIANWTTCLRKEVSLAFHSYKHGPLVLSPNFNQVVS